MSTILAISFLVLSLSVIYFYGIVFCKKKRSHAVLPPGPYRIPLIGNLHQIAKGAPLKLSQWANKYGKLYTIHFGSKPVLVINDAALMKQLFGLTASTGKFQSVVFDATYQGPYGVLNTEGRQGQELREFFIQTLKNVGFNKAAQIQPTILEEIEDLSEWINTQMKVEGTVRHLSERLKITSGNILWTVAVGERQEPKVAEMLEEFMKRLNDATNKGLAFFSWLQYIAPKMSGYTALDQISKRIHDLVQEYFEDPRRRDGNQDDVISAYINRVKTTTNKESTFYGEEGLRHSLGSVVSLMLAGTETMATTLNWLIFYLAVNPEVQRKMQGEIDEIIGEYRDPTLEDRKRLPYTQAVIEETLRMSSVAPFGVIQVLKGDISFLQYQLPKGLLLLANIFHAHHDPKVWGDPENFRPERFLETGNNPENRDAGSTPCMNVTVKDNVVAFQPGKRSCPGDFLARDVVFLSATKLLKKFWFSPETGRRREEYMTPSFGYILVPKMKGVLVKQR